MYKIFIGNSGLQYRFRRKVPANKNSGRRPRLQTQCSFFCLNAAGNGRKRFIGFIYPQVRLKWRFQALLDLLDIETCIGGSTMTTSNQLYTQHATAREVLMGEEKFRILAIDDSKDILDLVQITLSPDYHVLTLHESIDSLEIIEFYEPDLVILDVMMPRITGYQVLEHMKSNPKFANVLAIFLSAKDTSRDIKYGYKLGANLYLTKPFQPERLLKNVQMLIAQAFSDRPQHKTLSMRDVGLRMQLKIGQFHFSGSADPNALETDEAAAQHHPRLRRRLGQEHDEIREGKKWQG
jgi:CheY-like chemotaxis protein